MKPRTSDRDYGKGSRARDFLCLVSSRLFTFPSAGNTLPFGLANSAWLPFHAVYLKFPKIKDGKYDIGYPLCRPGDYFKGKPLCIYTQPLLTGHFNPHLITKIIIFLNLNAGIGRHYR